MRGRYIYSAGMVFVKCIPMGLEGTQIASDARIPALHFLHLGALSWSWAGDGSAPF